MKLYRVAYSDPRLGSQGFGWYSSQDKAERAATDYVRERQPEPETGDACHVGAPAGAPFARESTWSICARGAGELARASGGPRAMKATIVSTDQLLDVDGVQVRVWRGETELGIPFFALIHRVAIDEGHAEQFKRELVAMDAPKAAPVSNIEHAKLIDGGLLVSWGVIDPRLLS